MPHSEWYADAAEKLVTAVQSLSQARSVEAIMTIVKNAARDLTGADGATFVLRDGDKCYYAEENAIAPLWKGKRFPMETCISGWVMMHATHAAIEDIYQDPRIPADAYRPTFVKSLLMVPIRREAPIGGIGNYWASTHKPHEEEISILQALADTTSVALENVQLYENLQEKIHTLETREKHMREQQEALEIFTRALAHDLKEPMRTIHSFSEIIKHKETLSEKGAHYFRHIEEGSKRMLMLIDTVFQYTQIDDPKQLVREAVDADEFVRIAKENLSQLIKERNAVIESVDLPAVMVNKMQAVQLFQNLIGNAITHNTNPAKIQISTRRYKDSWEFTVQDNGQGIEAENIQKIFEPFKRINAAERGAGLGLSICRKIVELHGGKIRC